MCVWMWQSDFQRRQFSFNWQKLACQVHKKILELQTALNYKSDDMLMTNPKILKSYSDYSHMPGLQGKVEMVVSDGPFN